MGKVQPWKAPTTFNLAHIVMSAADVHSHFRTAVHGPMNYPLSHEVDSANLREGPNTSQGVINHFLIHLKQWAVP